MSLKPTDYYIGAFEFFGVLLPGALLTYFALKLSPGTPLEPHVKLVGGGTEGWAVFLVVSFIIGWAIQPPAHILNWVYDHTYRALKRRRGDDLYEFAQQQMKKDIPKMVETASVYRWAEVEVRARDKEAAQELALTQGVSKLFRAITLFLLVVTGIAIFSATWLWATVGLAAAIAFFLIFAERRWNASCLVYQRFKAIRERTNQKGAA
jgi:hypothetical protein